MENLADQIRWHSRQDPETEACGYVVEDANGLRAVHAQNTHPQPMSNFRLELTYQYLAALRSGELRGIWHSHPVGQGAVHSEADKRNAEQTKLASWLYSHETGDITLYLPCGHRTPLEGRPYVAGILDCYALVRDHYRDKLGIELPDADRTVDYENGHPHLAAILASVGAVKVTGNPKTHDVVLMACRSATGQANHVGVMANEREILHHRQGKPSGVDLYAGYWLQCCVAAYRHPKLCN